MKQGVPEPQAALDRIVIIENNDPLVDLRSTPNLLFRDLANHNPVIPFLRKPVADMLAQAAAKLAPDFQLMVISALRDFTQQQRIWDTHYTRNKAEHPDWPESAIRRLCNKYAAPTDHPAPPGHTTGGAVDVVLVRPDGSYVDIVPPDLEDWSLSYTFTNKISPETRVLRMLLHDTMIGVGFSNCRDEYWHYSYGDSGWAVRTGKKECMYGVATPPILG